MLTTAVPARAGTRRLAVKSDIVASKFGSGASVDVTGSVAILHAWARGRCALTHRADGLRFACDVMLWQATGGGR